MEGQILLGTNDANGLSVRNYRIQISYDGTDFAGWQIQPKLRTVQGEIEKALSSLVGGLVRVHGSGRTDSGVHALGQVAHFRLASRLDTPTLERALDSLIPPDIHISGVAEVSDRFDARRSARARSYLYRIIRRRDPHLRRYAWEVRFPLDLEEMERATKHLLGSHDCTSFAASTRKGMDNRIDIRSARWSAVDDEIKFQITGNRFVHRFVRNVVGTMINVGRGETLPDEIPRMVEAKDRTQAGPAAPAHGLYLLHVDYDLDDDVGDPPAGKEGESDEIFSRHG